MEKSSDTKSLFPIVGIGASAGGLEALKLLLQQVSVDTNLALVIVQHLDPSHESILSQILSTVTKISVQQVTDNMTVKPSHVYVVPPNVNMTMENEKLKLASRSEIRGLQMPIDHFFRSLAQNHGSRAIGMILSGTGSDGALGLEEIKDRGGITFVQDPKTAKFSGMPESAISASAVDFILPIKEIAQELMHIAHNPYVTSPSKQTPHEETLILPPTNQDDFAQIFKLLSVATGVDFTSYKHSTILRRITRRIALKKMEKIGEYVAVLHKDPNELKALYHDLLIKVTGFFRDPETFESLKQVVIPRILEQHSTGELIRIWVAGCASGEEVYSIAISFLECLGNKAAENSIRIFATDIDEVALQKARTGTYLENIALDVSPEQFQRFFTKIDRNYRINKSVRDMCTFAKHNLCKDPPFSNLNLVSCRNVLIYLEPAMQKRILPILHYALKQGGFLTLGTSETIGGFSNLFTSEDKKHKIYSKKSGVLRPLVNFVAKEFRTKESKSSPNASQGAPSMDESRWKEIDVFKEADRILLNQYAPVGLLIDEQMDILQFRGDTSRYLMPSPGKASLHLLNMAREGLLSELTAAIDQAKKTGAPSSRENIPYRYDEKFLNVTLKVIPINPPPPPLFTQHFIVLFEENSSPATSSNKREILVDTKNQEVGHLRQELQATKQYLQSIIENQDSTNEELKSANEEILSSNEELQSTNEELETAKEELQSTNEELTTVNEEVQNRNLELSKANDDLNNLFSNSNLPLIMVGRDLRIRRFTQVAETMLHLTSTDTGSPLGDVKLNIFIPALESLLLSVIETGKGIEREIENRQGHWYSIRILPYKTAEKKIEGVILLFINIDSLKSVEKLTQNLNEIKIARNYSEGIVQTAREPLLILSAKLRVIKANPAFYQTFHVSKEETENQFIFSLGDNQWDIPQLRKLLEQLLPKNNELHDFEVEQDFLNIGHKIMLLNAKRIVLDGEGTETILLAIEDITERKQATEQMTASLKEKEVLLQEIHHRVKNNLQIISSLLKLWPSSITDPKALKFFKESQDRIQSIALVHEKLLASANLSQINMEDYIQGLLEQLLRSYPSSEKIDLKIQVKKIFMEANTAFPFGLILNELVSNIFRHAFTEKNRGQVLVALKAEPKNQFTLLVQDNGVGVPGNIDITQASSFGLHLVNQLVDQLGGHLDLDRSSKGTAFKIQFPSESAMGG